MTDWEKMIERYCPEGQRPCNCRQAYETLLPPSQSGTVRMVNGEPTYVEAWVCRHGCSANQISAREHIAKRVVRDLP